MTRFLEPTMTFRSAAVSSEPRKKERCPNAAHLGWKQKLVNGEWRCECGDRLEPVYEPITDPSFGRYVSNVLAVYEKPNGQKTG